MKYNLLSKWIIFIVAVVTASTLSGTLYAQASKGSYFTTAEVPLRSGPGSNYSVVTTLPKGITITVVGKEGYWLKVESKHGGKPGYIDEQFAAPMNKVITTQAKSSTTSVAGPYRTLREIDLRQGPGNNYPRVTRLPAEIKINVTRAEGDWLRVESKKGGKPGYVERRDVERLSER